MQRRDVIISLAVGGLLPRLARAAERSAVTGSLDQWKTLPASDGLEPAFEYLAKLDLAGVTPGRTPIIGDDVYAVASKYTTRAFEAARFEAHRKYLDIQYVVSGQETIGFLPSTEGLKVLEPYDAEKDIELFAVPEAYARLAMRAGQFALLRPGQAHMPNCHLDGPHDVTKVVVKVSAAWHAGV